MFTPEDASRDSRELKSESATAYMVRMPEEKDPGAAFFLSLLAPGVGQLYCGKRSRGVWTLVFFVVGIAAAVFGWILLEQDSTKGSELLLGTGLRAALALYVFAFLDAYYTARELSDGTDSQMVYNPRVAAILNFLTRGFGYWYLDERRKGVFIFFLIGVATRASRNVQNPTYAALLELGIEIVVAVLAADAYRIARHQNELHREKLASVSAPATALAPSPGLQPHIPLTLAGLFVGAYVGFVALGILMPNYDTIDQSSVRITELEDRLTYQNPKYGVEMQVPFTWQFTEAQAGVFAQAEHTEENCMAIFLADSRFPWTTLESYGDSLVELRKAKQPENTTLKRGSARLGNLAGVEILFHSQSRLDLEEETLALNTYEHFVLAAKGLTVYALIFSYSEPCSDDVRFIRESVTIGN